MGYLPLMLNNTRTKHINHQNITQVINKQTTKALCPHNACMHIRVYKTKRRKEKTRLSPIYILNPKINFLRRQVLENSLLLLNRQHAKNLLHTLQTTFLVADKQ